MDDCFERNFQLGEDYAGVADSFFVLFEESREDLTVGAGTYYDAVFSTGCDGNQRYAGRAGSGADGGCVYASTVEAFAKLVAQIVVSKLTDHLDGIAEARCGDGLIGSFAAGMHLESGSENGFAACGNVRSSGYEVHVDAADDDDWFLLIHI
jgi:hypothetical protein